MNESAVLPFLEFCAFIDVLISDFTSVLQRLAKKNESRDTLLFRRFGNDPFNGSL